MKPVFTALLISGTLASHEQSLLSPGKNSFEKKWVKNTSYEMGWYALKDTEKIEIGKVSTQIVTDKDNITVITLVNMKNAKSPWVDSTIADLKTLSPVRHSSSNSQRDMALNFGKVVTGFYHDKRNDRNTVIRDTTTAAYFDSNLYPVLIGWLPLREGYQQDISIYDYNPASKTGVIKASVTGVKTGTMESVSSGPREVWVVSVTDEIGNGESTYYFDKKDRKLWKQEINAGGRKMLMQLVEQ